MYREFVKKFGIPGGKTQRNEYIRLLKKAGYNVDKQGVSLYPAINGLVLQSLKYSDKKIGYVTDPINPGLLYWYYIGKEQGLDNLRKKQRIALEKAFKDSCKKKEDQKKQIGNVIPFPDVDEKSNSIAAYWAELQDNLYNDPEYQNVREQIDDLFDLWRIFEMFTDRAFPVVPLPPEEVLPTPGNRYPHQA